MSRLSRIDLPGFGRDSRMPQIPLSVYRRRMNATLARMDALALDMLAVYADREHCAHLAFLTGFDPRFEEALLLVSRDGRTRLLVGNECAGYLPDDALGITWELFQEFSLPGQSRAASRSLRTILREFGIGTGCRVGCAGWKSYSSGLLDAPRTAIEIPAFLVDLLRDLAGGLERVVNANDLFIDPQEGLRVFNEPEQIALYEYASCRTSDGVLGLLRNLRVGSEERELERFLDAEGLPLSCHRMMSFGRKARRGLSSPSNNPARLGDPYTTAFGVTGALTCRAGAVAAGPHDLAADCRDFYDALARNYFDVLAAWYGSLQLGARAGAVVAAVDRVRDASLFRLALNPGHYLHLDEWVNSPFVPDATVALGSGMALQSDLIPVAAGPFCTINGEDGVVLADAGLRGALQRDYPACWDRIKRRRAFMRDTLGIALDDAVLPLSNLPAWLPPYALDLTHALAC
jgi:hypothetical protein